VTTTAAPTAAAPASALRRNRTFRLLWAGQALSAFGSSMSGVALPLALLAAGHPVTAVAAIGTAVAAAGLAARLPAGVVSDRFAERRLLIGCDLVRLAAIGALAVYAGFGRLPLWPAFGAVVVSTCAVEVFKPTQGRLLRRVVPPEQIASAVSLNQARTYGADIAGPAAAGLLTALRPELPFAVDAFTFLVSALCVAAAVPGRRGRAAATPEGPAREDAPAPQGTAARRSPGLWVRFTAGWRYLAADPFLRRATLYFCGLTVAFTATGTALLLGVGSGHGGARAAGWAISTAAVAGLAGSLAAPRIQRALPLNAVIAAGPTAAGVLLLASWLTGSTLLFVAGFSAMCLLVPVINAAVGTIMATSVPEEVYGRVATANDFTVQLLQPCGPLVAGLLVSRSLPTGALGLGAALAVLAVFALTLPSPAAHAPGRA
jgi:MFS family permease